VTVSAAFTPSSGVLLLNLSTAAALASPTAVVVCTVAGFTNAAAAAAAASVSVSTFDAGGWPLQIQGGVEFPSIFPAAGSSGGIILSSYLAGATQVVVSASFIAAALFATAPFKTISITGLRFSAFNASAAAPNCSNLNPLNVAVTATMTLQSGVLLLSLSAAANPMSPTTPRSGFIRRL
jgi:hypothetical protein